MLHDTLLGLMVLLAPQVQGTSETREAATPAASLKVEVLPVRPLTRPRESPALPVLGPLLPRGFLGGDEGPPRLLASEPTAVFEADALASLLSDLDDPEEWERDGVSISARGNRLRLVNDGAAIERVRKLLRELNGFLAPNIRLEVVLFDRREQDEARRQGFQGCTRLTPSEAAKLARSFADVGAGVLHREVVETTPGNVVHSGYAERGNYVVDVNVEVATDSFISDPEVRTISFATGLTLLPVLPPSGPGMALLGVLTRREPGVVRPMAVKTPDVDFVDQVECKETQVVFSLYLPGNGGFLFAPGGTGHENLCAFVRVERTTPLPPPRPDLLAAPHELLTMHVASVDAQPPRLHSEEDIEEEEDENEDRVDGDQLVEWIEGFAEQTGEEDALRLVTGTERALLVRATPPIVQRARALLASLARDRLRTFLCTLHLEARPARSREAWRPLGTPRSVPVLGHQRALFLQGHGLSYVVDANVEIAQGAAGPDPVIDAYFDGTQLAATVRPEGERCRLELTIVDTAVDGLRATQARSTRFDHLVGPKVRTTHRKREFVMDIGSSRVLGRLPARRIGGRTHDVRARLGLAEL